MAALSCVCRSRFSARRLDTRSTAPRMRSSRLDRASNSCCGAVLMGTSYSKLLGCCVRGFRLFHERGKCGCIASGQVGQNLAIQIDAGFLQTADEFAVGNFRRAAAGADADNPQRTKIAFLAAASDVGVLLGFFDGFLRSPIQL